MAPSLQHSDPSLQQALSCAFVVDHAACGAGEQHEAFASSGVAQHADSLLSVGVAQHPEAGSQVPIFISSGHQLMSPVANGARPTNPNQILCA